MMSNIKEFRECFQLVDKNILRWFPGHMDKGLKQMRQKLKSVDCVIEVHDARIPFSGRNPDFKHTVSNAKPHILVLNKKDLIDKKFESKIEEKLKKEEGVSHVVFTNCKDHHCTGVKRLVPLARHLVSSSYRFNRHGEKDMNAMVIGVPNIGKSSLINSLRHRYLRKSKAAQVGALAGITRSVQNRIKISEDPLMYLLDTPGILTPRVANIESGMRLSLCSCLQDHLVGEQVMSDYLLYLLNRRHNFKYVNVMGTDGPTDNIGMVLLKGALKLGKIVRIQNYDKQYVLKPDLNAAAKYFVKAFREGVFGQLLLDEDHLV